MYHLRNLAWFYQSEKLISRRSHKARIKYEEGNGVNHIEWKRKLDISPRSGDTVRYGTLLSEKIAVFCKKSAPYHTVEKTGTLRSQKQGVRIYTFLQEMSAPTPDGLVLSAEGGCRRHGTAFLFTKTGSQRASEKGEKSYGDVLFEQHSPR